MTDRQREEDKEKLRTTLESVYEKYGLTTMLSTVVAVLRDAEAKPLPGQLPSAAEAPIVHATVELVKALQMEQRRNVTDDRPWPF
jgi:hypothetical protein